jgi:hypothetical protein
MEGTPRLHEPIVKSKRMLSWLFGRTSGERGQAMILMALALPLVLGISLIAVDASNGFVHKRNLQNIADSAALAGAYSLVNGSSIATVKADTADYGNKNDWPLVDCSTLPASPTPTNCYQTPYNGNDGALEVRVTQDCTDPAHAPATTFFGKVINFFTGTNNYGCLPASARAVAGIVRGTPPNISFASLNKSCDNHTLVIRLSAHLTVLNKIYVNSSNGLNDGTCGGANQKGDGFDIFGAGGDLKDPIDILTHGGWETHDLDLVYVGKDGSGNYIQCPYQTANVVGGVATPAWQPGCPHVGQPLITDPFANLPAPNLADYSDIANITCAGTPCYNTAPFNPPYFLDANMAKSTNPTTFTADPASTPGDAIPTPSYIVIDGERMQATNVTNSTDPNAVAGAKVVVANRAQLGSPAAAHTMVNSNVAIKSARRVGDEITASTVNTGAACNTPSKLHVGDWIQVNLDPGGGLNKLNGIFQVGELPDDETSASPCQFEFDIPGASPTNHSQDFGAANITAVERLGGEAIVGVDADPKYTVGAGTAYPYADVFPTGTTPDYSSFQEELEDRATIDSEANGGKTFTYAQGMPDVLGMGSSLDISTVKRFEGATTVTTVQNTLLLDPFTAFVTYDPDPTLNGRQPIGANNKLTYTSAGDDLPPDKLVQNVTAWQRASCATSCVTTITTSSANVNNLRVGDWVTVHLLDAADTSFNGTFQVTGCPNNACSPKTAGGKFTYSQPGKADVASTPAPAGPEDTWDNLFPIASYSRTSGVATVTMTAVPSPEVKAGNDVLINTSKLSGTFKVTSEAANKKTITFNSSGPDIASTTGAAGEGVTNDVNPSARSVDATVQSGTRTVKPDYDTNVSGVVGMKNAGAGAVNGNFTGPLFQMFSLTGSGQTVSTPQVPFPYAVPAGTNANLPSGIYYGGICIGAPAGATCNPNAGGTCASSSTALTTNVTLSGVIIVAGGGFYICGNATVTTGPGGVMIYNTEDSQAPTAQFGKLGQVEVNTNGSVTLTAPSTGRYQGMTIWQGRDPAIHGGSNLALAPGAKCDGRATTSTDIALLNSSNGLNGFSGTIYAPNESALFTDAMSGTADMAVITGCILITAGSDATFTFTPQKHFGISEGLVE